MRWRQDGAIVVRELESSLSGLSDDEAKKRLERHGLNRLQEKGKKSAFAMFIEQFKDYMILILIAAAVVSGVIGETSDTIAIIFIVLLNAVIGFAQEYRAEKAMAALKRMAAPTAQVVRGGKVKLVDTEMIVPGDIVMLEAGTVVPADLRLLETVFLKMDEAALTGESLPIEKDTTILDDEQLLIGDRRNMAYKETLVTYGRGSGIAVATGMETELGKIAALLQDTRESKTPLQKRLANFGGKLAIVVIGVCAMVFVSGISRGEPMLLMLLTAISLAVAAIPEALPAIITISLAIGAKKMALQKALIRKLAAVEALGSVTYICSDKTGTLTMNRMTAEEAYLDGELLRGERLKEQANPAVSDLQNPAALLFTALALNNDVRCDENGAAKGDPTEVALYEAARQKGFERDRLELEFPRVAEIPFDAERRCMTTVHAVENEFISITKGAIDVLLNKASNQITSRGLQRLDREALTGENDRMTENGLRVLGFAFRKWSVLPQKLLPETMESELTFIGLTGLLDPPREEAKEAVALCKAAGIIPVMITGDHPGTARTIALRLGIMDTQSQSVVTGRELAEFSAEELSKRVGEVRVYARVAPEQKLKIVEALQACGQIVAMTGDGVNDAPALKKADIGIAMGITGTDVAKEASDMVLLDDNFSTIVRAVREGRIIYDNIRKFIRYLLMTNSGEIWVLSLAPLCGLPIPLLPIHILWINLVTDGLPALALSAEPAERDVMERMPRRAQESIFAHGLGWQAIWAGLLMGGVVLGAQAWMIKYDNGHWQTMVFTILCLTQLIQVMSIRSERQSLLSLGLFSNRYLLAAVLLAFLLQLTTIYLPLSNEIFKTQALTLPELGLSILLSGVVFIALETEKWLRNR